MGAHVFVVDRFSFPVHRSRGFCGVKNPMNQNSRLSLYADLLCIRKGDLVFFYQRRIDEPRRERGFRGIYVAESEPFFDKEDLEWEGNMVLGKCPSCKESYSEKTTDDEERKCPICKASLRPSDHILPNRVLIRPLEYFERPVDDNTAYINHTNHGMLWTMLFRKVYGPGRERSVAPLLPEEAEKLTRLLKRINEGKTSSFPSNPYSPSSASPIKVELPDYGRLRYENTLMAWMTANIDREYPVLRDVVGPVKELEYFGNNVLYGIGGEKVDLLLLHKRDVRYKATVIELKKDSIDRGAIEQITDYSYWVSQLSTANVTPVPTSFELQPVVIGYDVAPDIPSVVERIKKEEITIPYEKPCRVRIYKPILITYRVEDRQMKFEIQEKLSRGSSLDHA